MKLRVSLILFTLLLLLGLNGCSNDNPVNTPPDSPPVTGSPITGGEITVGVAQDLDPSFDPHQMLASGSAGTREIFFNVFEGLVRPTPSGELIPALAEFYTVDGPLYTFTLRPNVYFHNGTVVSMEDVLYSFHRATDPDTPALFVSALSSIVRIEAVDSYTLEIELSAPDYEFLAFLTLPIIPHNHTDHAHTPVGTGPFQFVSHTPQHALVLENFPDYWGTPAFLDQVTFQIFSGGLALNLALQGGSIDLAGNLSLDTVQNLPNDFYYLTGPMNLVQALFLNNAVYPLDNLAVRQALNYAVDVQQIMQILADGGGYPIGSFMHPGFSRYFHEGLVDFYPHNPQRAIELLTQAGYPNGFPLTITVAANYTPHVITAEILAEQLRAVNIDVEIHLVEWAFWLSEVNQARNFQATVIGIAARDLTARSMLERTVSDNGRNFINFYNSEYDQVFAQAQLASGDEQVALYRRLQEILAEDAASVFLQDLSNFVAIRNNLTGFQFYPIYVLDLATVSFIG